VAFRPGAVDLPANQLTAHVNAITISDKDFDNAFDLPGLDLDSLDLKAYAKPSRILRFRLFALSRAFVHLANLPVRTWRTVASGEPRQCALHEDSMQCVKQLRRLEANLGRGDFTARESDITLGGADLDLDLSMKDASGLHDMEIELGRDAMMDESFRPGKIARRLYWTNVHFGSCCKVSIDMRRAYSCGVLRLESSPDRPQRS
jgi:hypothetical protein